MASSLPVVQATGLNLSSNQLTTNPGALNVAKNVIIRRDNVLESRRGMKLYGTPFGDVTSRAKQIMEYRNRLIRHYGLTLQYDTEVENTDGQSIFNTFAGTYQEVEPGLRIKSVQANNNLYFTTAQGIKKISATSGDDFTTDVGYITNAGGIKALDISTILNITQGSSTGFLPVDSAVAYRVLWNTIDANNNLIPGTPSQRSIIYFPQNQQTIRDMNVVLEALDNLNQTGSYINDGNYVSSLGLTLQGSPTDVRNNLILLAQKLDKELGQLATSSDIASTTIQNGVGTIVFNPTYHQNRSFQIGDEIYLNNFQVTGPATDQINGVQTVSSVDLAQGVKQDATFTVNTALITTANPASYFTINSARDERQYYVWYFETGSSTVDPQVSGRTGLKVVLPTGFTQANVASITAAVLNTTGDFVATPTATDVNIVNTVVGSCASPDIGTTTFTLVINTAGVDGSTITFKTTSTASTATITSANIESGWFRAIPQAIEPATPATHSDTDSAQQYLLNIILELQSTHNVRQVEKNDGIATASPLEVTTVGIVATTVTINNDAAGNATNFLVVGDQIYLNGLWNDSTGSPISFAGLHTLTAVGATSASFTQAGLTGPGVINSTSTVDRVIRYTNPLKATYIDDLDITTTANVDVTIDIPSDVTVNDFFQIYRSTIVTAATTDVLTDLVPDDEMKLVYEAYPTQADIDARTITVTDIVPDSFIQGATNLYTNQFSGETISQSNDRPPVAHDINTFKGYTFYANTRTRNRAAISLLGLSKILQDYNNGLHPSLTITDGTVTNTYNFVKGVQESTQITVNTSINTGAVPGTYFLINNANDSKSYYVWYYQVGSSTTDPLVSGRIGIAVQLPVGFTAAQVASATSNALNVVVDSFSATSTPTTVVVTNVDEGPMTDASAGTSSFTFLVLTQGAGENVQKEVTNITFPAATLIPNSGTSAYFLLYTPFDRQLYYVWFQRGTSIDPALVGRTGVQITLANTDTNAQVATKVSVALDALQYSTVVNSNIVTVSTDDYGPTEDITPVTATGSMTGVTGYSASITTQGALDVLLSNVVSPSLSVDITSNSLVRVINKNTDDVVNAYYISDINSTPGNLLFESKSITSNKFYLVTNQTGTGDSFNPTLAPDFVVNSGFNTAANPTVINVPNHGFRDGDSVVISGSQGSTPLINGVYNVMNVTTNTFTINVNVLAIDPTPGNVRGSVIKAVNAEASDNEVKPNRIYYSKYQQPEAVPVLNYVDVGAQNKAILRIFPLIDSLFIFKEDGLYRLSSETAPFNISLFNSSCLLIATDSVDVSNNVIYCWTRQGISGVTEGGVETISRDIDTQILPINNFTYSSFSTATWGFGYESDNSYTVYTVSERLDTVATIAYRFCTLTKSWTTTDKSYTCGKVKQVQDKIYTGCGDTNFLEVERKQFDRTDYADREYVLSLSPSNGPNDKYLVNGGTVLSLGVINTINIGDVLAQDQTISIFDYNSLLEKLDLDSGPADSNYFDTLEALSGDNLRTKLVQLATKLDNDANVGLLKTFVPGNVNTGTDTFTITGHGFINGDTVKFIQTTTLPSPLNAIDTYYIINASTNTFQVSTLFGGPALNLTTVGSGTNSIQRTRYQYLIVERIDYAITSNSAVNNTVVTSPSHGLHTGRYIQISNVADSSPTINSSIYTVTVLTENTFTVPVNVVTAGTGGKFNTLVDNFKDIFTCFNLIINELNEDVHIDFTNYELITNNTLQEAIIVDINNLTKQITLNIDLPFIQGAITLYNAIHTEVEYAPQTLGDPLGIKHMRESTLMFENKTFTNATMSFASDLLPEYQDITFDGLGNGIFGHIDGFGDNYFGGNSHSAPFRTYIPRQYQRCRYLKIKYTHGIAREKWSIFGLSLTGSISQSPRAYR